MTDKPGTGKTPELTDNFITPKQHTVFSVYYALTGSTAVAGKKAGYQDGNTISKAVTRYNSYNLPLHQTQSQSVLDQLEQELPTKKLVKLIAGSIRKGEPNSLADKCLQLYVERERTRRVEKYRQMDIQERFEWILNDTEFMGAIEKMIAVEHVDERLTTNQAYWSKYRAIYGRDRLLEVKSLINKVLKIPVNVDKQELDKDSTDSGENGPG